MQRPLTLITALLVSCPVVAQVALAPRPLAAIPASRKAVAEAGQFRGVQLEGAKLKAAVKRVTKELSWHKILTEAQREADQVGKPVLWLQILGDLDGHT